MTDDFRTAILDLLPARPRLLALGEPTHGENALLDMRNDLFRQLVEQDGYRTITLETDCLTGLIVDEYVTSGTGALDDVLARGLSHGWGAFAGNRDLVRWMRAYNDGRSASEQVRFAGFDGPLEITGGASPGPALTALHAFLSVRVAADLLPCDADTLDRLIGDDDRWPDPAAMTDPARSVGRTSEARQLRLLADDLAALLVAQAPQLVAASTPDEWDRARLYARTATGLLSYHYWMAATSTGRLARILGVRDSMMAANLLALAERGPTLVYAHNGHLQRDRSSMRMGGPPVQWWGAGALVSLALGAGYAFLATALGTIGHRGVHEPPADTLEGRLHARPADRLVIDPRDLAGPGLVPRVSPWFGYAPLDLARVGALDGIVFVKDA